MLCRAVVALGSGVGEASEDAGFDRWPSGLDRAGHAVRLGGGGMPVEAVQPGSDEVALGVGPGPTREGLGVPR